VTGDILRYSVSLDIVEKVSSLNKAKFGGIALQASDRKTIYYFGGDPDQTDVHKFDSSTNVTVRLSEALPSSVRDAGGISIDGEMFLFDGLRGKILQFSEESETARVIGELPFCNSSSSKVSSTTVIGNGSGGVWLFAGNSIKPDNPILLFNTTTKDVSILSTNTSSIPTLYVHPASVFDGRDGYLIGGLGRTRENDGSTHPGSGFLR
jgi:hypothetical protein